MYSVVLLAAMTAGDSAPALHKCGHLAGGCYTTHGFLGHKGNHISHGSYGACYGACYGMGYTGWVGYGGWSHPHAHAIGSPSPGAIPVAGWGAPYGSTAGWGAPYGGSVGWGAPYGGSVGWGAPYGGSPGWGAGYGGYWPGYACYGGCGGYAGAAYSGVPFGGTAGGTVVLPPGGEVSTPKTNGSADAARLVVELPEGAKLYVDDKEVKSTGTTPSFRTPALEKGQKYYYDLRAVVTRDGQIIAENLRVVVTAGQTVRAAFRELGGVSVAARKR